MAIYLPLSSCYYNNLEDITPKKEIKYCDTAVVSFSNTVVPILQTHCANPPFPNCHHWVTNYTDLKNYIDLGRFEDRVLIKKDMPVPNNTDNAPPLSAQELEILECWLSQGAPNN
jgi:hypothetical protein